jgi:glutathione S-transferase
MIRFYGAPASSAGRTHWMLEEIGVPYEYKRMTARTGETQTPEFLAMNPAGTVPFVEDGDLKLFESIAINFYLAEKYAPALWPGDAAERARIYQWSLWAITNVQPVLMDIMNHMAILPEADRSAKVAVRAKEAAPSFLAVIEKALHGKEYLVANQFSVADVNAGSVINLAPAVGCSLDAYPSTAAWLARLKARPAYKRVAAGG